MSFLTLMVLFIFCHALADYPLQGDYLAKAKTGAIPGANKYYALFMHSSIHAGFVFLLTGSYFLMLAELVSHFIIDELKNRNKINYAQDQILHLTCKVLYVVYLTVTLA